MILSLQCIFQYLLFVWKCYCICAWRVIILLGVCTLYIVPEIVRFQNLYCSCSVWKWETALVISARKVLQVRKLKALSLYVLLHQYTTLYAILVYSDPTDCKIWKICQATFCCSCIYICTLALSPDLLILFHPADACKIGTTLLRAICCWLISLAPKGL